MFDIWDEENELMKAQYERDNYKIIDPVKGVRPYCVIYFSSNGLYFPNTEESFKKFVENDRYEWEYYHFKEVRREIYVRDIYKQWYIAGINSRISSPDKLIAWLKEQIPKDCMVVTVGNSSGGYMAVLAGCLLNARWIYNFSGQYSIEDILEDEDESHNALFRRYVKKYDSYPYLNLMPMVDEAISRNNSIIYMYPALCRADFEQAQMVKGKENIYTVAFEDDVHGRTVYNYNLKDVFENEPVAMCALVQDLNGEMITRFRFSVYISGLFKTLCMMVIRYLRRRK